MSSVDSRKELNKRLIRARKLEYQHREGDNSELVVASFGYFIGVSNRGITLRRKGVQIPVPPSIVLKHITILSDGVSISSNAIAFCMVKNIPIDFFDSHSLHIASIVSPKFLQTTHWDMQSRLSLEKRVLIAKKIIVGKLRNQLNLIKYFHKYHKTILDFDVQYTRIESSFKEVLMKLRICPILEQYQESIMAQEAQGALLYWEYVRLLIEDDDVGFEFREHQGATDLVNSMLNYGYAILYPRIWQAILRHRLNPYMGFIHYQDGNANLVFDIIELFRSQAVDRVVISMIQKKERLVMKAGKLDDTTRSLLTKNIFERLNRYEKYRGVESRFADIINLQVTELTSCLTDNTTYRPYIAKW